MEPVQIYNSMIEKPNVPKFYRELQAYYQEHGMLQEAKAVGSLIENKFIKNHEKPPSNSHIDQE